MVRLGKTEEKKSRFTVDLRENDLRILDEAIMKAGDSVKFLIQERVLTPDGSVLVRPDFAGTNAWNGHPYQTDIPYDFWKEAIEQWSTWKGAKMFGERRKLESYESIVRGMTVEPAYTGDVNEEFLA